MVLRSRETEVELALLATGGPPRRSAARSVVLNLFQDADYLAVLDRVETVSSIGYAWVGIINGVEYSQVVLAVSGGVLSGSIDLGTALYTVRHVGGDRYVIAQVDRTAIPRDGPSLPPTQDVAPRAARGAQMSPSVGSDAGAESGDAFDLLVYYTVAARIAAGGVPAMNSQITRSVTLVNEAYAASGIPVRTRLVTTLESGQVESGRTLTDLNAFRADPNVRAGRERYSADLVCLITVSSTDGFSGRADQMPSNTMSADASAYSVVVYYQAIGAFALTHELGHNQGANHEPGNAVEPVLFPYAYGFIDRVNLFYDVMSYPPQQGCPDCRRINQFSSPVTTYQGHATGTATQDNARTITETRVTVANFRQVDTAPVGAPSLLVGAATGSTVTLRWVAPNVGIARSYIVELGSAPGLSDLGRSSTVDATTSFQVSGVPSGRYYIRVRASGGTTESAASNEVLVIVGADAPSNLLASVSGAAVLLTWSAPSAGVVRSYLIEAGSAPGLTNLASLNTSSSATTFEAFGVPNGTYFVRVKASDGINFSAASNEVSLVVGSACSPPSAPTGLGFVVGGATVVLNWIPVNGATSYVLEAGSVSGASDFVVSDTGNSTPSITASNVGPRTYYVRVRAKSACGTSGPSNEVTIRVL